MNIVLATPLYASHFDAGHFWLKALNWLAHFAYVWDYRVFPTYPHIRCDFTLVLKGEGVKPQYLPQPRACYWPDALERTPGIEKTLALYERVYTPLRPTPPGMVWLPTGWDPDIHHYTGVHRDIPSLYIGTYNAPRKKEYLEVLKPLYVAGNNWGEANMWWKESWDAYRSLPLMLGPHYLHDFVALASRAQVAINIHQGPVGLNRKLFELIPCAFTITDRVPGVEEVLGDITEAVSFTTPEEGKALLDRWLAEPAGIREEMWNEERKKIAPFTYLDAIRQILG